MTQDSSLARIPAHLIEPEHPPRNPAGHAPVRRPGSVRRTSSLDVVWPGEDYTTPMHFSCRARDLHTPHDNAEPRVVADDRLSARVSRERVIEHLKAEPGRDFVQALVGAKGGGHLREALNNALPDRGEAEAPLYLLIDDLAGSSLVAIWAWTRWVDSLWDEEAMRERRRQHMPKMEGICIGYRPGASSLNEDGTPKHSQNATPVLPLQNPDDPHGWHPLPEPGGVHFRRARRIDVWREGGLIRVDAGFQDSANDPKGGRVAIHEYSLRASADPDSFELLSVEATPGTLPYSSCPAAPGNIHKLVGTPMNRLRYTVLEYLAGTEGCTHLNDALRALAEVPVLLAALDRESA